MLKIREKTWRVVVWGIPMLLVLAGVVALCAKPAGTQRLSLPVVQNLSSHEWSFARLPPEYELMLAEKKTHYVRMPGLMHTQNHLLVGLDRSRSRLGGRADSLHVVALDPDSNHAAVIALPRDLHVEIEGVGAGRINAVMRAARRQKKDPLEMMRQTVERVIDAPVISVSAISLGFFEQAIDALGGVEVDVPCALADNFIDDRSDGGRRVLDVEAGRTRMDGKTAAMFVRSRHGRSDWSRQRRQQAVLKAIARRVRSSDKVVDLDVFKLAIATDGELATTLSRFELLKLARVASRIPPRNLHGVVIGHRQVQSFVTAEGQRVLSPDYEAIDKLLANAFSQPALGARPKHARCQPKGAALR